MRIEFKRSGGFGNIPRSGTWDTDAMPSEDARELTHQVCDKPGMRRAWRVVQMLVDQIERPRLV